MKQQQLDAPKSDARRIADAIERGEVPEDVTVEDAPASERRLDQRKSKATLHYNKIKW